MPLWLQVGADYRLPPISRQILSLLRIIVYRLIIYNFLKCGFQRFGHHVWVGVVWAPPNLDHRDNTCPFGPPVPAIPCSGQTTKATRRNRDTAQKQATGSSATRVSWPASRVPIDASLLTKYVDIDLDNLQNDYIKLKERLAVVSQERDDATNKVCTVVLMFDLLAKSIIATRRN